MAHQGETRTPEFKRSNRLLVPSSRSRGANGSITSGVSSSNFSTSSSGGSSQPPLFVPRRRSFGIVIKAHDPDRVPTRARRSRSRSRSRSGSRSSSISSLRSALNRAKSRSLGDIDMEGESIIEEEVDRRRSIDVNRQQSFRNFSSSPRRRSLSRGSMGSMDSGTSIDFVKSATEVNSSRQPMRRKRSNEFSESTASPKPRIRNEAGNIRDRSSSQSTLEVNFRLDNQKPQESKREQNRGKVGEVETRSRAAQYELVQQRKRPSDTHGQKNQNASTSNQTFAISADVHQKAVARSPDRQRKVNMNQNFPINHSQMNGHSGQQHSQARGQPHQNSFHSTEGNGTSNFTDRRLRRQVSLSSDEGTDLDDIPWGRAEDLLLDSLDNKQVNQGPSQHSSSPGTQSSASPSMNRSYINSSNTRRPYTNMEAMQPMLPPKNPPKRPTKISIPQQQHHVNQFRAEVMHHNHPSNKENFHAGQVPPALPPKSFSPRLQTEQMQGHFSNSPHSPSWSAPQPTKSGHPFPTVPQQPRCGNHVGLQGFSGANPMNSPMHQQGMPPSTPGCPHTAIHTSSCNDSCFRPPMVPVPLCLSQHPHSTQMNRPTHQCSGMHGDAPPQSFESPHTVKFSHGSPKLNDQPHNAALLNSQRQFKSTANFRNAGLLPANQNMQRAKSTEVLSFGGRIRSEPEFENLEAGVQAKKTKSRIVLDDISLSSLEEFHGKSNKPKLSEEPKRGKLEMWSGLLHFFTICSCLLTTVTLAIVSNQWDRYAHKCPLFVENNLQHDRYWGNPSMVPCYMSAYLPLLVILISVGLVFVHGGLLVFWRSDRKSSSYYMTRSFGVTVTFFNVVAFGVALAIACVLTDGLRQTCLSFKLVTDYNFRPVNCQMGFDSLDLNYNLEGTLYLIIFGTIGAWISVIFTLISVVMYTIRAGCCRCTLH